jgi:hypothetical protein
VSATATCSFSVTLDRVLSLQLRVRFVGVDVVDRFLRHHFWREYLVEATGHFEVAVPIIRHQ